ncbi:MAG TPA: PilN domain-containing protein [bacterium]|nr:PilN domain-containing protein [bacterium]HPS28860.1 PilN domain-containing protein [bacterium]
MIKINLLPVKDDKLINEAKGYIIIALSSLAVVIVLIVLNSSVLAERENESRMRIEEADKEIANLKSIMGEIQNLKEKKAKLQEKMDMIIRLQEQNIGPVRVLDELSLKLPSNKIWIEDLSLKGDMIDMNGKTLENQEVANFMKQLENSLFFSGVNLKKVTKDKIVDGVPMLSFGLNTVVYLAGRQEQPAPATAAPAATGGENKQQQ